MFKYKFDLSLWTWYVYCSWCINILFSVTFVFIVYCRNNQIILTGLSMRVAVIQPDRTLIWAGSVTHFLLTGHNISILRRSFLVPIPPTAYTTPLWLTTPGDLLPTFILPISSHFPVRRENLHTWVETHDTNCNLTKLQNNMDHLSHVFKTLLVTLSYPPMA